MFKSFSLLTSMCCSNFYAPSTNICVYLYINVARSFWQLSLTSLLRSFFIPKDTYDVRCVITAKNWDLVWCFQIPGSSLKTTTTTTTKTPTVYGISWLKTVRAGSKVFVIDTFPLYVIFLHAATSFAVITFKLLSRFQHYSNSNFWYERNMHSLKVCICFNGPKGHIIYSYVVCPSACFSACEE